MVAMVFVWTLGEIAHLPTSNAVVADIAPTALRGRYQGLYVMSWGAASVLAPIAGGAILDGPGSAVLWLGVALLCTGLFGLMTGIADGQHEGWVSDTIVARLAIGALAGVAFILWELHTPRALLDVRIFANVEFSAAALIACVVSSACSWAISRAVDERVSACWPLALV